MLIFAFVSFAAPKKAIFVYINQFNVVVLEQLNIAWQGISILSQSCFQCC